MKARIVGFIRGLRDLAQPIGQGRRSRWLAVLLVLVVVVGVSWSLVSARGGGQTQLDLTLQQLEEAVLSEPQNPQARLGVAIAYAARGYNAAAIEQFQEVLKLEENNQTALMGLGRVYLEEGRLDEALGPLLKVAELNKDNPFRQTLEQLEAVYYDLGIIYLEKRDYNAAMDSFGLALEINAVDADAWHMLGRARRDSGDLEGALAAYGQAVRLAPDFVEAYRGMAGIYKQLGREGERRYATGMMHLAARSLDDAVRDLRAALVTAPDLAEAHQGLAMGLESQGKFHDAIVSYQRALDLDPSLIVAQLAVERLKNAR